MDRIDPHNIKKSGYGSANFTSNLATCHERLSMRPATNGERPRPHGMTGSTELACPRVHPASGWKHPWNRSSPRVQPERIPGRSGSGCGGSSLLG